MSNQASSTQFIRAVVQDRYGSPDVLRLARIAMPEIGAKEVLIRVHSAGLDRGAWHVMTGRPYLLRFAFGVRRPANPVPGREFAGTVAAVGSAVTGYSPGLEVYGIGAGSFAEYVGAREDKIARKPVNLSFEQAAVLPISGLTALQSLCDVGKVREGQQAMIIGASGGVGTIAVQLAKSVGAEVTGVCSAAKSELVRSLGADHVIDYARQDFLDGTCRYDLILDLAGNSSVSRLRQALTRSGTVVIAGGEQGGPWTGGMDRQLRALALSPFVHQRLTSFLCKERSLYLDRLTHLIESATVTPSLGGTYPLEQAREAMRRFETGSVRGKIAITM